MIDLAKEAVVVNVEDPNTDPVRLWVQEDRRIAWVDVTQEFYREIIGDVPGARGVLLSDFRRVLQIE